MSEVPPPPADRFPFPREYVGKTVVLTLTTDQLYVEFAEPLQSPEIAERLARFGLRPVQDAPGTPGPNPTSQLKRRQWLRLAEGEDVARVIAELRADDQVRFANPVYHRADLLPTLTGASFSNQLLVRFAPNATDEQVAALLRTQDAELITVAPEPRHGPLYQVRLRAPERQDVFAAATALAGSPLVRSAAPDWMQLSAATSATPHDQHFNNQWNLYRIGAPTAWDISRGDPGIVIAIVDSGCDLDHPDLHNKYVPLADRRDVVNNTNAPDDVLSLKHPYGHGTQCAGIAAAETDNGLGVAGVGWNCSIMPIRMINELDHIDSQMWVVQAIDWARTHGADVISMSWYYNIDHPDVDIALDNAHSAGLILVAAAGNCEIKKESCTTADVARVEYPASHSAVIAVGATDDADRRKQATSLEEEPWHSRYGRELSVVAPGVIPYTTIAKSPFYLDFRGTSAATPHVAGLAGLLLSLLRNPINVPPGVAKNDLVRHIIEWTAAKVGGYAYASDGAHLSGTWHEEMGYGRIDAGSALRYARDNYTNYKLVRPSYAYAVSVRILLGLLGDGTGIVLPPGGPPVPVDPGWAFLPAEKRDVLLGLVITELAEGVTDPQARRSLQQAGREAIERAARQIGRP
jgi:subtilisin family serine protease